MYEVLGPPCKSCDLYKTRKNIVFGEGPLDAKVMIIGEAPGEDEDVVGRPFVGRSGKLLRRTLSLIGFDVDKIFITNILQCRPPGNRNPKEEEIQICSKFLTEKLTCIKPKMIITPGKFSTATILGMDMKDVRITKMSGSMFERDIPVFPLVHPSFVLRGGISPVEYLIHTAAAYNYAVSMNLT